MTSSSSKINWYLKFLRLKCRLHKIWSSVIGTEKEVYVWDRVPFYKEIWESAAVDLSAKFSELAEGFWEISYGNRAIRINNHQVQLDDPVVLSIAGNKPLCYEFMQDNGLPVPGYRVFKLNEIDNARRFMDEYEGPFVVKPALNSYAGKGVTTHVNRYWALRRASVLASLYCNQIIIESFIPGEAYRILMLNGKMIHASRRRGLRVIGDGKSTIQQLLFQGGASRLNFKGENPHAHLKDDFETMITIKAQGFSGNSIIENCKSVLVKGFNNPSDKKVEVRTVYNEDVTNLLCEDIIKNAEQAVKILDSQFAGVDIITVDPSVPLKDCGGVINEINTTPGLQHHYNLANSGNVIPPAVTVLKHLLRIYHE